MDTFGDNQAYTHKLRHGAAYCTIFHALLALCIASTSSPAAQDGSEKENKAVHQKKEPGIQLEMKRRPSLRFGKSFRMDFRARFQGDLRGSSPDPDPGKSSFELHRKRLGIEGTFLRDFEYEAEAEVRSTNPWRDVYINYRHLRQVQLRAGKFKLPFGREELTSAVSLDYIDRARISDLLAPGRDLGVALHGRFFQRALSYEAGLFVSDGENARTKTNPGAERTFAARVTSMPLRLFPASGAFKNLELGFAYASSTVPAGLKGLRGRTIAPGTFFPYMYVHGRRTRVGTEAVWSSGPFSISSEFMRLTDQRRGQGLLGQDLPELLSRGWYLSGTWAVTGEKKAGGIVPRRPLWNEGGYGALELAARYEQLRFGGNAGAGQPSRSPRAANVLPNTDHVLVFGLNWYLNQYVKLQINLAREILDDPQHSPVSGQGRFWTRLCRLQFAM